MCRRTYVYRVLQQADKETPVYLVELRQKPEVGCFLWLDATAHMILDIVKRPEGVPDWLLVAPRTADRYLIPLNERLVE